MASGKEASSLRRALREGTADAHRRLDSRVGVWKVTTTHKGYAVYLDRMSQLHTWCQPAVATTAGRCSLQDNTAELLAAIDEDLQTLDVESLPEVDSIGECSELSDARAWGIAYVIEGSALGSRYTLRAIKEGLSPSTPTAYLDRMAAAAEERWPQFASSLQQMSGDPSEPVAAALKTFRVAGELFAAGAHNLEAPS